MSFSCIFRCYFGTDIFELPLQVSALVSLKHYISLCLPNIFKLFISVCSIFEYLIVTECGEFHISPSRHVCMFSEYIVRELFLKRCMEPFWSTHITFMGFLFPKESERNTAYGDSGYLLGSESVCDQSKILFQINQDHIGAALLKQAHKAPCMMGVDQCSKQWNRTNWNSGISLFLPGS